MKVLTIKQPWATLIMLEDKGQILGKVTLVDCVKYDENFKEMLREVQIAI